jgi:hypothetical protein
MAHVKEPDFVFRRNGRVQLNRQVPQFGRLLAVEVCASAVLMLDTPCFEVVWRVLATHSIRQFPLHFPSSASPCAIIFQLDFTTYLVTKLAVLFSLSNTPLLQGPWGFTWHRMDVLDVRGFRYCSSCGLSIRLNRSREVGRKQCSVGRYSELATLGWRTYRVWAKAHSRL